MAGVGELFLMLQNYNYWMLEEEMRAVTVAGEGAFMAGLLPLTVWSGVWRALGVGYEQAREAAREDNFTWGFAEGYVMGLLGWQWHQVASRFGRYGVIRVHQTDEALNVIRVNAYNAGLKLGFAVASVLPSTTKKASLSGTRKYGNTRAPATWTRNDQISYVIELAAAFRKRGMTLL